MGTGGDENAAERGFRRTLFTRGCALSSVVRERDGGEGEMTFH